MNIPSNAVSAASILFFGLAASAPAHATDLVVANESALRFVCLYDTSCSNSLAPGGGGLPVAKSGSDPRLKSSSFAAKPGTPAAGNTIYVYRVDLAKTDDFVECVAGLVINFGAPLQFPLDSGKAASVVLMTSGGEGTVAVKSAEQDGDLVQVNFDGPVCRGDSSMSFGLASANPAATGPATLLSYGHPPIVEATAEAPARRPDAPTSLRTNIQ